ncbi:MAG: hypothetical protein M1818_004830 [Claussenomyces sp. TS43310]|nr:MAG: hypothetical protein M1818_004830 [Claussenomyces sp. TS43310]
MLRPATPLTILLFAAFVCLLISVISTPVVKAIPLATYAGVDFGVFGYCKGSACSNVRIGYDTRSLFTNGQTNTFDLNVSTRHTLSAILVVHPIAAFFTLVLFVLAGSAHLHSPSHSPRYLLGMFILSVLTLVLTLLSFLIDVLLFVPHMAWGSYIVLAATILIAASVVVSCAMRRTLVGRKARQRRIAENAEMNGENFYNRQAAESALPAPFPPPALPVMTGANAGDKAPSYATYEETKAPERVSDERIPLTASTPHNTSPEAAFGDQQEGIPLQDRYGGPPQMGQGDLGGPPKRDEYGNALPPQPPFGSRSRDHSQDSQYRNHAGPGNYRGRGGPNGMYRGRGGPNRGGPGYPGGRGGYGPPNSRGGYSQSPQRGPPGVNGRPNGPMSADAPMRGGRGGPPAYNNAYGPQNSRRAPSPGGSYGPYGRRPSGNSPSPGGYSAGVAPAADFAAFQGRNPRDSLPRAESPPPLAEEGHEPVGQAIEMDATTGSPSQAPAGFQNQYSPTRDRGGNMSGMVGLQQQKMDRHGTVMSETSRYSNEDAYVPPHQAWAADGPAPSSPLAHTTPVELPDDNAIIPRTHHRTSSGNYYEDVAPQFAEAGQPALPHNMNSSSALPATLTPGYSSNAAHGPIGGQQSEAYLHPSSSHSNIAHGFDGNNSNEDLQSGSRSPADSDRSNFTSISQRGVNPRWNPAMGPGGFGPPMGGPRRPPPSQRNEILLNHNPDFELPGMAPSRRGGMRGGMAGPPNPGGRFSPNGPSGMVPRSAYDGGNAI